MDTTENTHTGSTILIKDSSLTTILKAVVINAKQFADTLPEQKCRRLVATTLALHTTLKIFEAQKELNKEEQMRLDTLAELIAMSGLIAVVDVRNESEEP